MPENASKAKTSSSQTKKRNTSSRANASEDRFVMMKNVMHDLDQTPDFLNSKYATGHVELIWDPKFLKRMLNEAVGQHISKCD